jgi:hypothetical protein
MRIQVDLFDENSVKQAVKQIHKYKRDILKKERMLLQRLEQFGATKVSIGFARSVFTEDQEPITVTASFISDNTVSIQANGKDVAFVEFGAGVRFGQGYLGERPEGIVGIGEYGKGRGKNPKGWWYSKDGESKHSYGNPPSMTFYSTMVELTENITDIAKEVFRSE